MPSSETQLWGECEMSFKQARAFVLAAALVSPPAGAAYELAGEAAEWLGAAMW